MLTDNKAEEICVSKTVLGFEEYELLDSRCAKFDSKRN
jgi:hypothetical protein